MAASKIKAAFQCDIKRAWNTVTSLYNYQWRSDLSRIEVLDDKRFVEYTPKGYSTTFTVTCEIPYERWEFDMENELFVKGFLKKQQRLYVSDLKKELEG